MIVVLSGEGPSDLGACNNAQGMCRKPEFVHGPMTVLNGFNRSALRERGVPMIPKPKSEAWLLCAVSKGYQHCAALEELSGNDDSDQSAKKQLHEALNGNSTSQDQIDWLDNNGFDLDKAAQNMPSYQAFKNRLVSALAAVR
jgi:hypothetical protein